jgi:molybdopterin biosynthesis enzyme
VTRAQASCRRCKANFFIVLPAAAGNVAAGEEVDVQLLEGLI